MGLIKKKKKSLKGLSRGAGATSREQSPLRPKNVPKTAPCGTGCPNHNQIRRMLMTIQKAKDFEKTNEQAFEEAWQIFMETTPFPSVCGRVCPHPCESECNRKDKEGAVGINSVERFIGDYALEHKLVPKKVTEETRSEKIAVVGSGPGGMSAAYHLARHGYPVTVFEAFPKAGGMLRYGIPDYRLPAKILDAEINRILEMGVELKLNTSIGHDISMDDLKNDYKAVFVAIGAHQGRLLRLDNEDADGVWTGTEFLHKTNDGEKIDVGEHVVVIGGGDTAIDAARISKRLGAKVTILYRRTRTEMPAIDEEIVGADEEGIQIEYLAAPIEIFTNDSKLTGIKCQRMELGEPDSSGRRRPVPIEGDTYDMNCSTLVAAISQQPDFEGFEDLIIGRDWIKTDEKFKTKIENIYAGGDNIDLGLVIDAIFHGRRAAEAIHELITDEPMTALPGDNIIRLDRMVHGFYEAKDRVEIKSMPVEERFKDINAEIVTTWTDEEAVAECMRCMSCGKCFDCGNCWSYCQDNAVVKPLVKGEDYKYKLDFCTGCKKCAENCPCGYIEMH